MLATRLAQKTGRLRTAITNAGNTLHKRLIGVSNDARTVADNLVAADGTGSWKLRYTDPDMPRLIGQSGNTGIPHIFTPDEVRSTPILDSANKVVGVSFPSQLKDEKGPIKFAPGAIEAAKKSYLHYGKTRGSLWKPMWFAQDQLPAPWSEKTVFARAHANKNVYVVQVRKKIPFTKWSRWVPTQVNGESYGKILAADKYFKQAVKGEPTAELIQMSCSAAAGPAARESAESMHSTGIGLDVHATEKTHFYTPIPDDPKPGWIQQNGATIAGHGSDVDVKEFGHPEKSPWVEYRAARRPADTQG